MALVCHGMPTPSSAANPPIDDLEATVSRLKGEIDGIDEELKPLKEAPDELEEEIEDLEYHRDEAQEQLDEAEEQLELFGFEDQDEHDTGDDVLGPDDVLDPGRQFGRDLDHLQGVRPGRRSSWAAPFSFENCHDRHCLWA